MYAHYLATDCYPVACIDVNILVTEGIVHLVGEQVLRNYIVNVVLVYCTLLSLVVLDHQFVQNHVQDRDLVDMSPIIIATQGLVLPALFLQIVGVMANMK